MDADAQGVRVEVPNPFNIFPALIWQQIISNLESPVDLWNLLEAFPRLHEVTKPQEILFDKVLPLVFKDLDKKDVLTCREVCKWWKEFVTYFLENHPSQQPYDSSSYDRITDYRYCTLESKGMSYVRIVDSKELERKRHEAQDLMEHHSKVPIFVGRSVKIGRYRKTMELLKAQELFSENGIGDGVWYVKFVLPDADRDSATFSNLEYYEDFQKCLAKLPNLKALSVGESGIYSAVIWNLAKRKILNGNILSLKLPDILSLESLELTGFGMWKNGINSQVWSPRQDFFHVLLNKYAPQLRKLNLSYKFWKDEYGSRLQYLTELNLLLEDILEDLNALDYGQESVNSSNLLRSVPENLNSPNLEKFGVELTGFKSVLPLLKVIFEIIQTSHFKVLTIKASKLLPENERQWARYRNILATLPSVLLLTLTLNTFCNYKTLSMYFSICFPNLEYLEIGLGFMGAYRRRSNVEISEVWKRYPNLKVFVLYNVSYARELCERD